MNICFLQTARAFITTPTTKYRITQTQQLSKMTSTSTSPVDSTSSSPPLYLAEGLVAIHKPLTWTSNDVVSYIRGILERDAKDRGYSKDQDNSNNNNNKKRNRRKKQMMKVGHGGTLDPLASGVLVLGIGKGTTLLQDYLQGDKHYSASCHLGYQTDTLDAEGKIVKEAPCDHIKDITTVEKIIPKFMGKIEQIPPMFSAIRVDGKRLYEIARNDSETNNAEEVEIPKREVEIYGLQVKSTLEKDVIISGVVDGPVYREKVQAIEEAAKAKEAAAASTTEAIKDEGNDSGGAEVEESNRKKKRRRGGRNNKQKKANKKSPFNEITVPSIQPDNNTLVMPQFALNIQCGGGTYIRSLVRDIGYELDTVATMTGLVRTKQGPFLLENALTKDNWTAEKIYDAVRYRDL